MVDLISESAAIMLHKTSLGLLILAGSLFAGCADSTEQPPIDPIDSWTDGHSTANENWQQASRYAFKVSDQMLTDLHDEAWGIGLSLACGSTAPMPKGDGVDGWVRRHFDTSDDAAAEFRYNREGAAKLDIIDAATQSSARDLVAKILQPTWHAYTRAKHEHALHLKSVAEAAGREREFCSRRAP